MLSTRFTKLVGCTVPIQQAGMGSFANPRLAAAVARAGGLGMVTVWLSPELMAKVLDGLKQDSAGAFGANFLPPLMDPGLLREQVAVAAARVKVVDFFYSDPDATLAGTVHAHGALCSWQVGSLVTLPRRDPGKRPGSPLSNHFQQ